MQQLVQEPLVAEGRIRAHAPLLELMAAPLCSQAFRALSTTPSWHGGLAAPLVSCSICSRGTWLQELLGLEAGAEFTSIREGGAIWTDQLDRLDNLLKQRLAAFLGKQEALIADLRQIQAAIKALFAKADSFYTMALDAAKKQQEFSFAARYARTTARTALVDVSFDLAKPGIGAKLQRAIAGDFDDLLVNRADGVTLHTAELTHNITRNVSVELTLPFGRSSESASTLSSAKLSIIEDGGRVLLYALDATDESSERSGMFRARSGRDSSLTVAATLPIALAGGVKTWKSGTFTYSYRMERAVRKMRVSQLIEECEPLVHKYIPSAFGDPRARSFREWAADLDKSLDGKDPNSGTHDIGDTLISLTLAAPPEFLQAWTKAPANRKDPVYKELSKALQRRLKELVTFYAFSDPAEYKNFGVAAPAIVFSCLSTTDDERRFDCRRASGVRQGYGSVLGSPRYEGHPRGIAGARDGSGADTAHEIDRRHAQGNSRPRQAGGVLCPGSNRRSRCRGPQGTQCSGDGAGDARILAHARGRIDRRCGERRHRNGAFPGSGGGDAI